MDGADDLAAVDALQVDAGDTEVGVSELALDDNERNALVRHLNFATFKVDLDSTPMLKGLPGDRCTCPHWGYVLTGKVTYTFDDHEETNEAGDNFLRSRWTPAASRGRNRVCPVQPR